MRKFVELQTSMKMSKQMEAKIMDKIYLTHSGDSENHTALKRELKVKPLLKSQKAYKEPVKGHEQACKTFSLSWRITATAL